MESRDAVEFKVEEPPRGERFARGNHDSLFRTAGCYDERRPHSISFQLTAMRIAFLIFVVALLGCNQGPPAAPNNASGPTIVVEPDTRPAFVLDASKPFVIELGRGGGLDGYDIVKFDQSGKLELTRRTASGDYDLAALQLTNDEVQALVQLVKTNQLTSMGRMYSDPHIADGSQWILWIEQQPAEKSIYFNNAFPAQITALADGIDALLDKADRQTVSWLPDPEGSAKQSALSARIRP
jgi:hypothetical protein